MSKPPLIEEDVTLTGPEGEELQLSQIGMAAMHGDREVETVAPGEEYIINGQRFS